MIVVSGSPRSGTSMLMNMLQRGGVPTWVDFDDGRFEAKLPSALTAELTETLAGPGCVKIFDSLLLAWGFVPEKMLQLHRPVAEIMWSWERAFPAKQPLDVRRLLAERRKVATLPGMQVSFHKLIDRPMEQARLIARFLGEDLDVAAMAAVPDQALRHFGGG